MSLITLNKIGKEYAGQWIFQDINCSIHRGQRIGLVGPNGTGKSTLLKIIAGIEDPSRGQLQKSFSQSVGYLEQDPFATSTKTLYQEMLQVFKELIELQERLDQLGQLFHSPDVMGNTDKTQKYLEQYGTLQTVFEMSGGYEYESKIRAILTGLEFSSEDFQRPLFSFSGGERTRAALAQLLLQEPDLLLLDEPTNHMDLPAIEWLEKYLQSYKKTILLISHDRVFLERTVNHIFELHSQQLHIYPGSYDKYRKTRHQLLKEQQKAYVHQQAEIAKMERFIQRFKAGTRSTQAKSVEKRLEKMERIEKPIFQEQKIHLSFSVAQQPEKLVLECKGLKKRFAKDTLFQDLNLKIYRGERLAITGANGTGKSTLLKIMAGKLSPDQGDVVWGRNVMSGYFSQHFEELDHRLNIYENIYNRYRLNRYQMYSLLGQFLFSADDLEKEISSLSGGEKNRVALAYLMAGQPNVLLLDEPTNHLDLESREVLLSALDEYSGTIVFISHDRYFTKQLATRMLEFPID